MVQPSQKWLDKFNDTLVPEMFVKIIHSITESGLQEDATPSTNGEVLFSNVSSVMDDLTQSYTRYATGELNFTPLDGTYKLPPKSIPENVSLSHPDEAGYVSELCVTESVHPTITLSFSKIHTTPIPGISIVWSTTFNEWATSFKLTTYLDGAVISTKTISGNTDVSCEVEWEIYDYDSVSIEILEWCISNRRARVEKIRLGQTIVFEKSNILSYKHESSRDPISGQMPNDNITFTIDNSLQVWNPINPDGLYRYLYERQPISVKYGMDLDGAIEWIDGGIFFLSEWDAPSNGIKATFTARDIFGYLASSSYTGRMYGTLYEMAYDALELLNDNSITFQISSELKEYSTDITKQNKSNYKNSDILQMVANAAGMAVYQTRDGVVTIGRTSEILAPDIAGEITVMNNFDWPEISFSAAVKNVSCSIDVTSDGETTQKNYSYPSAPFGNGVTQTVSNEMLSRNVLAQQRNILTEAYKILLNRKKMTLSYRASPHFDALDYVKINDQFGNTSDVLVTRMEYQYSGCFHGTLEGYIVEERYDAKSLSGNGMSNYSIGSHTVKISGHASATVKWPQFFIDQSSDKSIHITGICSSLVGEVNVSLAANSKSQSDETNYYALKKLEQGKDFSTSVKISSLQSTMDDADLSKPIWILFQIRKNDTSATLLDPIMRIE